ncbi:MAG: FxsA family protein [Thermoleophilaceae bacterium]
MPAVALLLLFIVLPIAELYVIYLVGDAIGIWWTLGLLAADSVLGTLLLRSQGRAVWHRFSEAVAVGRMPHREVQEGVAVIFGSALLVTPGFLTDILGVALLLPPTRALMIRYSSRWVARLVLAKVVIRRGRGAPRDPDVEGTATEYPPTDPPRIER